MIREFELAQTKKDRKKKLKKHKQAGFKKMTKQVMVDFVK